MLKPFVAPGRQSIINAVAGVVLGAVVIGGAYWTQTVLIPIALAVFLTFLLVPLVTALQRAHLGRKLSVFIVVLLTALILGGVIWLIKVELASLAGDLPSYTENIQNKIKYLRQMGSSAGFERLGKLGHDISNEWGKSLSIAEGDAPATGNGSSPDSERTPAVIPPAQTPAAAAAVQPEGPSWLSQLVVFFSTMVASFGRLALALVLVVFMLLEREALRNRLFWLVGSGRMTATTKALDDAAGRISRYLLMQLVVNSTYGFAWGTALYLIGVDYALLWGFLATVLRYVPYIGAPVAALFPVALSLAQFSNWWPPIAVVATLLVLELVSNNLMEPWLYGRSIGVSPVAMLIAAAFWIFLWGPIGLILSGPLTVCLVVLGKHIPSMKFFAVLLGDVPVLDNDVSYYQRLVARDQDEATKIVLTRSKATSPEKVYDELLVQALVYTQRDRLQDFLTEADEHFVLQATQEVLEDLGERRTAGLLLSIKEQPVGDVSPRQSRVHILACPARDHADKLALEMLHQLLNPAVWDVEITAVETLTVDLVTHVTDEKSVLICIGSLPPGGLSRARYLCKRLRATHPNLKIIVGRWGLKEDVDENRAQLIEAGADLMATTLLETCVQLNGWMPVLAHDERMLASRLS